MAKNVSTYIKNVGKSLGYAVGDVFTQYNPVVTSLAKQTKETTKSMYESIKSIKIDKPDISEKSLKGEISAIKDDIWNGFKDDLKSGNWYDKSKNGKFVDDLLTSAGVLDGMGLDDDFDFDFDDDDWGFDDDNDSDNTTAKAVVASNDASTRQIVGAVGQVGFAVADSVSNATAQSADYIVRSNKEVNKAMYNLNQRGFNQVTSALLGVNKSVLEFAKIGEPLTTHMQNSGVFFTKTTETLNKMSQTLEKIATNTTQPDLSGNGNVRSPKNSFSDIFDDSTGFNVNSYIDMIKDNFSEYKDLITDLKKMNFKAKNGSSIAKNASVMSFITKHMVEKVLFPNIMKEAMQSFNETLKYTMGAGILGLRDKSFGNGIGGLIIEILKDSILPSDNYKAKINTSNYEKGKVAWDGYSRKALVEVIPGYLSKIYNALTGKEEAYSYDDGKFISRKELEENRDRRVSRYAKDAGGDFREDALSVIKEMKDVSKEQQEKLEKEIETYFVKAFQKGSDFMPNQKEFNYKKFGLSEDSLKILNNLLEEYANGAVKDKNGHYNRAKANKFRVDVATSRDSFGYDTRRREATGIDDEILLNNGLFADNSKNNKGGIGTSSLDRNPVTLLQGILQNTEYLANNIGYISGRTNRVARSKRKFKGTPTSYFNIENPKDDTKGPGEKTRAQANKDKYAGLDEDEAKKKKREDDLKTAQDLLNKKSKEFSDNFEEGKENTLKKTGLDRIRDYLRRPIEAVVDLLNMASSSMNKLFMGDKETGQKGIIGTFTDKINSKIDETFNVNIKKKIRDFFDELFGKKDKETGKREGGKLRNFVDETKEELKNAGKWVGDSVKQFFKPSDAKKKKPKVDSAAYGRKVTKSGIVAVSEGELIVPSELNPFYHGTTNKKQQVENESRIIDNFYGSFYKGGTVGEDDENTKKDRNAKFEHDTRTKEQIHEDLKNKYKDRTEGAGHKFFREGFETIADGATEFFNRLTGNGDKKSEEDNAKKDNKTIRELASKFLKEAGDNKGAMGAGALIGGGVSILTGAVVGPLFGAAIGSAVGLTIRSKTIQKLLFGEEDKDGKYNGGLIGSKMSTFINKNVPTMAKGATIGGIGGLFMGSPILGAILGSTIGYVKTSEEAKQFIFGKVDKDGKIVKEGVISQDLQKKVKKAAPSISAGVILGALAGPFSLPMNLMVGAGLGYLASANSFHEYLFGKKGDEKDKGLAGLIKDKVIDNLDEIFHNWGNALKASTRNLFKSMGNKIKDLLTRKARAAKDNKGSILGKILGFGDSVVKGSINFVGNRLSGINRRRKVKNLNKGYNVYDKKLGRNMFASERMKARGGNTNGTFGAFDSYLANASSSEDLDELEQQLEDLRNPSRIRQRSLNSAMTGLYAGLDGLRYKDAKKIGKYVEDGKTDKALGYLQTLGLSQDKFAKYSKVIEDAASEIVTADQAKNKTLQILKNFKKKGMNFSKESNIDNALDMIRNERKNAKFSKEEQEANKTETFRDRLTRILASIDINIAKAVHGVPASDSPDLVSPVKKSRGKDLNEENLESVKELINDVNSNKESKNKTIFDAMGNPHRIIIDRNGNEVEDMRDKETRESNNYLDKMKNGFMSLPGIAPAISGLGGLFKNLTSKITGDEKKPGLLDKIKNLLDWDGEGPLSKLFSFFTNSSGTKMTGKLASKFSVKTILGDILIAAIVGAGLTGKLDDIASKFVPGLSDKKQQNQYFDKETGTQLQTDEKGNPIKDENGNYVDINGNVVNSNKVEFRDNGRGLGESLRTNFAKGAITGKGSVAGSLLKKTIAGKATSKVLEKVGSLSKSLVSGGADDAVKIANDLGADVWSAWNKITTKLMKAPIVGKRLAPIADKLDDMGYELAQKVVKAGTSKGAKSLASFLSTAVIWVKIAFCADDFITGYEDASSTLGIVQEATVPQKLLCGLLRVVKNLIPIVGTLIPDETIINLFAKYIAPAFGMDLEEFNAQREEAKQTVEQYNKENNTDLSVKEYNKTVRKDYTLNERVKNTFKTGWNNIKDRVSKDVKGIKEKGLIGYGKQRAGEIKNAFTDAYDENGGGVFGAIQGLGDAFTNIMPGTLGQIIKKNSEVMAYATKGDLSGMWKVSLDQFTSDTSKGEASVGMFSKVVGQIPLFITKIGGTPVALVSKLGSSIGGFFGGVFDKVKKDMSAFSKGTDEIDTIVDNEDSSISDIWKVDADFSSPISKIFSFGLGIKKITGTIGKVLESVLDKLGGIVDKVKGGIDKIKDIPGNIKDGVVNGAKSAGNWVADKASGAFNSVKDFFTGSGSGVKIRRYSGNGSGITEGFVSQVDPKYNGIKIGNSSVAENGCAPAVATMVANNLGKNLSMSSAISSASKYQNGNGTTADYFGNVLKGNGIKTNYLTGNNVAGQTLSNLANGNQVILLGRDANNNSKMNSPFGPNGHYVVATGLDQNGNIIVNDPESNAPVLYNSSILTKANIGIAANASGGGANSYDTANAQKIWGYFTSKGYSPAATAGIMGNLFQESGLRPDAIQGNGKGPAAGLAQWENYNTKSKRWANLNAMAQKMGYKWSDLDPQLAFIDQEINNGEFITSKSKYYSSVSAFKQATDPTQATEGFELAFERAGKPNMKNRINAATQYYNLYQDSSYTGSYSAGEPGSVSADGTTSAGETGSSESESKGPVNILSAISTAFSKIGDLFNVGGSNDSGETAASSAATSGADGTSGSANLGAVPQGKGNAAQKKIVQYAESILNKDQYSQDPKKRQMVGRGYSDCSSFAQWCYKNAINVDPGGNTGAMADSAQLVTVDEGSTPNVNNLEAGDLLLFRAKKPNGRTKNIGHVEVYDGNGNVIGHGSGKGPTKKSLSKYLQDRAKYGGPYVEARRYKGIASAGSGSGIENLLMDNNPGYRLYGTKIEPMRNTRRIGKQFAGGDSGLVQDTTNMLTGVKNSVTTAGNNGTISAELVQKLIQTITNILEMISNNTAPIADIYNVLSAYTQGSAAVAQAATQQQQSTTVVNKSTTTTGGNTDPNIVNLVGTLGQIARG